MENKETNKEDKLVKELFDSFSPSVPSDHFTKNTMSQVLHEWSAQPNRIETKLSLKYKLLIGAAAVVTVLLVYFFDIKPAGDQTAMAGSFDLAYISTSFTQSFGRLFSVFKQVPLVVYLVSVGMAVLLGTDKFVQRLIGG